MGRGVEWAAINIMKSDQLTRGWEARCLPPELCKVPLSATRPSLTDNIGYRLPAKQQSSLFLRMEQLIVVDAFGIVVNLLYRQRRVLAIV